MCVTRLIHLPGETKPGLSRRLDRRTRQSGRSLFPDPRTMSALWGTPGVFVEPPQAGGVDVLPPGRRIMWSITEWEVNGTRTRNPVLNPDGQTQNPAGQTDPEP